MAGKNVSATIKINFDSNIQELIDGINQAKHTIKQMESGDKSFDSQKYEDAMTGLIKATSQFKAYKDNIIENATGTEELSKGLLNIVTYGNAGTKTISNLATSLGASATKILPFVAALTAIVGGLKLFKSNYDSMIKDLNNMGINAFEGITNGIDWTIDALQDFYNLLKEVLDDVQRLNEIGEEAQQGYFTLFNYLGKAGEDVVEFTNSLEKAFNLDASKLVGASRGILGMVSNMDIASEKAAELTNAFIVFGQELSAFSGYNFEEVVGQLESAVNLGVIRSTSPLVRALDLTKEDVEVFRELNSVEERAQFLLSRGEKVRGTYAKWLQTSAGKVQTFSNALEVLNTTLGKITTGLLGQLAPVLTMLVTLINNLISGFAELINIDLTDLTENQGDVEKENKKIADSFNNIGKEAEKAKRKTASFDDTIQIVDSKQNNNSSVGEGIGNLNVSDWLNNIIDVNAKLTAFRKELEYWFANGEYWKVGNRLGEEFEYILNNIPWDNIQSKVYDTSKAFAEFFNGLTSNNVLGYSVGNTIAEAINTIILSIESLGENIDFSGVGEFLVTAWNGLWENIKTDDLANAAMNWFIGLFESINGFLSDNPFDNTGKTLADLVNSFFFGDTNSVTGEQTLGLTIERMDEIVNGIIGFIDGVISGIGTFLDEVDIEGIKEKLKELITRLMTSFAENSGDWGTTLNNLFTTIFDTARELIETADASGLSEGISNFLKGLKLSEILTSYLRLEFEMWWIKTKAKGEAFFGTLGNWILEALNKIWTLIKALIGSTSLIYTDWIIGLANNVKEWWNGVKEWGASIINGIGQWFQNLLDKIKQWFANIWQTVVGWVDSIKEKIEDLTGGLTDIKAKVTTTWSNTWDKMWFNPSNWDIPFLATGGIVNKATPVIVGDYGKEAVIPLENNTGWMDELAAALVSKMNISNNSGSNNITIDMSGYNKNFYTRNEMLAFGEQVVEALKLYGVNVAAVY